MGEVYKRGKVWYIDVRYKNRRIRKAVGSSKKIAELALKDAEVQIAKDKFGFSKNRQMVMGCSCFQNTYKSI